MPSRACPATQYHRAAWTLTPSLFQVTHNLHNLAYLKNLMRMVRALLQSNNLHIEPYVRLLSFLTFTVRECKVSSLSLVDASTSRSRCKKQLHQLMPPILTCLVGRRLCENPNEDHWELRDYAASLVALICLRYSSPCLRYLCSCVSCEC